MLRTAHWITPMLNSRIVFILLIVFLSACRHAQDIERNISFPDREYENAWLIEVNVSNNLVQIQTVTTKIDIVFRADEELLTFLSTRTSWLVPVSFDCTKVNNPCDFSKPYALYVA